MSKGKDAKRAVKKPAKGSDKAQTTQVTSLQAAEGQKTGLAKEPKGSQGAKKH